MPIPDSDLVRRAESGDSSAQCALGRFYCEFANGIQPAFEWYLAAAKQDNPEAAFRVAELLQEHSVALERDEFEAHEESDTWYNRAADLGWAEAQCFVGYRAEFNSDYETAMKWYRRAAEQGHPEAQYYLASLYSGKYPWGHVDENLRWLAAAAEGGYAQAEAEFGILCVTSNWVKCQPKRGSRLLHSAVGKKNKDAQYWLANMYLIGQVVPKDRARAFQLFRAAAYQFHHKAGMFLGRDAYERSSPDLIEAYFWFDRAGAFQYEAGNENKKEYHDAYLMLQEVKAKMTRAEIQEAIATLEVRGPEPRSLPAQMPEIFTHSESEDLDEQVRDEVERVCAFLNEKTGTDTRPAILLRFLVKCALEDEKWALSNSQLADFLYRRDGDTRREELAKPFSVAGIPAEDGLADLQTRKEANLRNLKGELKQKLHAYYEGRGQEDAVRLSLQPNSWRLTWTFQGPAGTSDKTPKGWERIEIRYAGMNDLPRAVSFNGKWVIAPTAPFETSPDWGYLMDDQEYYKGVWRCAVALTPKNHVVVYSQLTFPSQRSGNLHRVSDYESFADALNLEPEELIYQVAETAGIGLAELDI